MNHNWEYKRLGDICDKGSSNLMQKKLELTDEGYDVYGASGCLGKIDFYQQSEPYVGIVKDGSGVGRCKLYPAKTSLLSTMQYILGKPGVNIAYLCYLLQSLNLAKYVNGATIPHIYFRDYQNEIVPVPPVGVQEQIVAELDALNATLDKCRQLLATLDSLTQSLFYDTFGDPISNPKGWEMRPLKELSKSKLRYGSGASGVLFDNQIRYIRITDIDEDGTLKDDIAVSPSDFDEKYLLADGDILFARSGATVGKSFLYNQSIGKAIYAGYLIKASPKSDIIMPIYLYALTKTKYYKDYIINSIRGVAQPNVNAQLYGAFPIPVPPMALQEEFAGKIEAIEGEKRRVEATMAEVETLLASRMDYWFN